MHGHVHDNFDYRIGSTRVVANPRGYARNRHYVDRVQDLMFENVAFDPMLLIEVASR